MLPELTSLTNDNSIILNFSTIFVKLLLSSALLLAFHHVFLCNRASYKTQRLYLLLIPFVSIMMSGFTFEVYKPDANIVEMTKSEIQQYHAENAHSGYHIEASDNTDLEDLGINTLHDMHNAIDDAAEAVLAIEIILYAVAAISIVLILIAWYYIIKMLWMSKRMKSEKTDDGFRIVRSYQIKTAFSFADIIYMPAGMDSEKADYILKHEKAHIIHKHYIDVWIIEFMTRLMWFNPIMWMVRKQLRNVHEYEADRMVIDAGADVLRYQTILLEEVAEDSIIVVNGFNHSFIRRRFIEMKKKTKAKLGMAGKISTGTWVVIMLCAFTFSVGNAETIIKYVAAQNEKQETKTENMAEEQSAPEEQGEDMNTNETEENKISHDERSDAKPDTVAVDADELPVAHNLSANPYKTITYKGMKLRRTETATYLDCIGTCEKNDEVWSLCGWDTYIIDADTGDHYKPRSCSAPEAWDTSFRIKGMKGKTWMITLTFPPLKESVTHIKISGVYNWERDWNRVYKVKELE